jgi:hypothetical protein
VDHWGPLAALPAFLLANLRLTWHQAEEAARFTESI